MTVSGDDIAALVRAVLSQDGVSIRLEGLADDAVLLATSFPEPEAFRTAAAATVRALGQLTNKKARGTELHHDLEGWLSFHYQSSRANGAPADMRIVYRPTPDGVEVWSFGHRHVPSNFYWRLRGKERP